MSRTLNRTREKHIVVPHVWIKSEVRKAFPENEHIKLWNGFTEQKDLPFGVLTESRGELRCAETSSFFSQPIIWEVLNKSWIRQGSYCVPTLHFTFILVVSYKNYFTWEEAQFASEINRNKMVWVQMLASSFSCNVTQMGWVLYLFHTPFLVLKMETVVVRVTGCLWGFEWANLYKVPRTVLVTEWPSSAKCW